jgi:hypothetical protein
MYIVQGVALLQQGLPEAALEEWPQGEMYRSRKEATSEVNGNQPTTRRSG